MYGGYYGQEGVQAGKICWRVLDAVWVQGWRSGARGTRDVRCYGVVDEEVGDASVDAWVEMVVDVVVLAML